MHRPELRFATVEYVATPEYVVRPAPPPSFLFVVDVSYPSVQAGVLQAFAATVRQELDNLIRVAEALLSIGTWGSLTTRPLANRLCI